MIINTTVIFFGSAKVKRGSKVFTDNTMLISIAHHHVHFPHPTLPLVCCLMSAIEIQRVCHFLKYFRNLVTTCTNFKLWVFFLFEKPCLGASTHSNTFVCSVQLFQIGHLVKPNFLSTTHMLHLPFTHLQSKKDGFLALLPTPTVRCSHFSLDSKNLWLESPLFLSRASPILGLGTCTRRASAWKTG